MAIGTAIVALSSILSAAIIRHLLGELGADPAEVKDLAGRVAAGDVSMAIDLSGKRPDSLLAGMYKMVQAIKTLVADINMLSQAAVEGDLAIRVDVSKHQGEFLKIAHGLNATMSRLVELLDNMPTPCLIMDQSLSIRYINQAGARIAGNTQEQCIGTHCYDFLKTSDCHTGRCACVRAMKQGQPANSEAVARPQPGVELDFVYTGVPIRNPQGNIIGAFELISDQTATKTAIRIAKKVADYQGSETSKVVQSLDQLARGETVFLLTPGPGDTDTMGAKQTFDTIANAINTLAATLARIREEDRLRDWLKNGTNELNTLMRGEQKTAEMSDKVLAFLARYLKAGAGAFYMYDEKGQALVLTATYAFTRRKNLSDRFSLGEGLIGQAALEKKMICLSNVPPDYLQIGSALGEAAPRNIAALPLVHSERLVGALELGTFAPFSDHELEFLNQAMEGIAIGLGVSHSRQRINELLEQTQQQTEELRVQQEELQQTNEELEERAEILDKQRRQIEAKNREIEAASGELKRKAVDLEKVSAYKSEFLANMSHELRTPLNSMMILSGLLVENKAGPLTDKQREFAATINSAGKDLLNLINDILDLSKVEAGHLELHYEDVAASAFCQTLESMFRPQIGQKDLTFRITADANLPQTLHIDEQRTEQVVKNLLSNAFKFTERGSIELNVSAPAASASPLAVPSIAVSVRDTGIGIPADKQELVFQAFQQADGSTSRKFGGTGLGLSISRQLARRMGGDIKLVSEPGKGSVFTLYLPLAGMAVAGGPQPPLISLGPATEMPTVHQRPVPETLTEPVDVPRPLPDDRDKLKRGDKSILVIEDDLRFANTLMDMVREKGFGCIVAADGVSGIHLADLYRPNAIILDVVLPGLDGWGVMWGLKDNPPTRHIPVHFITCLEDRQKALSMGAVGFLTKPVSPEQLEDVFDTIEKTISKAIRKLLIIEDNRTEAECLTNLLENRNLIISVAATGTEAIDILGRESIDCIVLDLGLSDMSGFDLLEHIHQSANLRNIPAVIHTGRELSHEEEVKLQHYAKSIIIKGAKSHERLLNEVTLFLHMVESDLPPEKQRMIRATLDKEAMLEGKKVLIVDDDMRNVFALSSILTDKSMVLIEAENGREALAKLGETPDIDIILMDIMMPDMDGYEAIRQIRLTPRFKDVPIIAMTAKALKGDQEKCIQAGANDYISKPLDIQKLLSLLRVWLYRQA